MLKIRDWCIIQLHQFTAERFLYFVMVLFPRKLALAKFRENKKITKILNLHYYLV